MGRRIIALLRTVVGVPTFFVFTLFVAGTISIFSAFRPHHPAIDSMIRFWSRRFLSVAPIHFGGTSSDHLDLGRQYVFVSNHLSNFDIPLLFLAIPHRIRYLAKAELFGIPIVAGAMRRIGIIKIERGAGPSSHGAINEGVKQAEDQGYSIIVFPEGTRSRDGKLHAFKKGAFRIAISTGLDVVPVAVLGTWETWRPEAKVFFPGTATVRIGAPIPVADLTLRDIDSLRDRVHGEIEGMIDEMEAERA